MDGEAGWWTTSGNIGLPPLARAMGVGRQQHAIFIMRQVQEKHKAKKNLYYTFMDLEKAFDGVPREVVRWALRKLGVDEWLIRTVMVLYTEACTVVKQMLD